MRNGARNNTWTRNNRIDRLPSKIDKKAGQSIARPSCLRHGSVRSLHLCHSIAPRPTLIPAGRRNHRERWRGARSGCAASNDATCVNSLCRPVRLLPFSSHISSAQRISPHLLQWISRRILVDITRKFAAVEYRESPNRAFPATDLKTPTRPSIGIVYEFVKKPESLLKGSALYARGASWRRHDQRETEAM